MDRLLTEGFEVTIIDNFDTGTGKKVTVNKVARLLKKITDKSNLQNVYTDPRQGDIRHSYADITKAGRILAYKPKSSLEHGLTELVDWYIQRKSNKRE